MTDHGVQTRPDKANRMPGHRALWLTGLFLAELILLALAYQFLARIECQATDAEGLCRGLRSLVARALAVGAIGAMLLWARPALAQRLAASLRRHPSPGGPAAMHLAGVALLFVPLFVAQGADMAPMFDRLVPFWLAGAVLAAGGGILWLARWQDWRKAAGADGPLVLGVGAVAVLMPDLADLILPLWWHWPELTAATFRSVAFVLSLTGGAVHVEPAAYIIGLGDFRVHIAQQCSGVEGLALTAGFTLVYAMLFRDRIHPLRYALVVLPLGLVFSWCLNVLRIAALIVIGERISPDLAVNGFHSYAGWLFFTLLALGLMAFVQATPWLHRPTAQPLPPTPPLRSDWLAARIVPFVGFMLVSTLVAALFAEPELGYPVKTVALAGLVALFWPALQGRDWAPSWAALAGGVLVGIGWVVTAPTDTLDGFVLGQLLANLAPALLVLWIIARVAGTVLLVPLIEELFFRGYVLARLDRGGLGWRIVALAVSSGLFGLMHGRWLEAAGAGLVFGALMLWRGRLADAVWSHAIANAIVAAAALMRGDWSLI